MENRSRQQNNNNNSDKGRPGYLKTRLYVGNLPPNLNSSVLREKFGKYGKITSIESYHHYAFIQFEKEENAKAAISAEMFCTIKGQKINVNMAVESAPNEPSGRNERSNMWGNRDMPKRDRSPIRESFNRAGPLGKNGTEMENREFFENSKKWNGPPNTNHELQPKQQQKPPGPGNQYGDNMRDNRLRPESFDREANNNWTRPSFNDNLPISDNAVPQRPIFDASILITSPRLREYADHLKRRLENLNMTIEICAIPEDSPQMNFVEEKARHGVLYVIIICPQNEVYNSLTLHIFPGTPQEHRNMPLADAMNLVARNFERYLQQIKDGSDHIKPPTQIQPFEPPSSEIRYLLDLLADNRHLTMEELDKVSLYISNRKKKLQSAGSKGSGGFRAEENKRRTDSHMLLQHPNQQKNTDFQSKILSMITSKATEDNSADRNSSSRLSSFIRTNPDAAVSNMKNVSPEFIGNSSDMKNFINFGNPAVKKALENLLQSGPDVLKNISAVAKGLSLPQQNNLSFHGMINRKFPPTDNSKAYSMDQQNPYWGKQLRAQMPNLNMKQQNSCRPNHSSVNSRNRYFL
ncbi:nuclear receptor coactivator 5-like isoform X1 [Argonauta hians]